MDDRFHMMRMNVNVAIVISPEAKQEYDFYQNVAENVGPTFRVLMDSKKAITWLTDSASARHVQETVSNSRPALPIISRPTCMVPTGGTPEHKQASRLR